MAWVWPDLAWVWLHFGPFSARGGREPPAKPSQSEPFGPISGPFRPAAAAGSKKKGGKETKKKGRRRPRNRRNPSLSGPFRAIFGPRRRPGAKKKKQDKKKGPPPPAKSSQSEPFGPFSARGAQLPHFFRDLVFVLGPSTIFFSDLVFVLDESAAWPQLAAAAAEGGGGGSGR